jgi:phosphotransferase system enzyme I (PtsI)
MQVLRGIALSPGIALGPVVVRVPRGLRLPPRAIPAAAVPAELERLDRGLASARDEAIQDETEVRTRLGPQYADILAAHSRMIADPTLRRETGQLIEQE